MPESSAAPEAASPAAGHVHAWAFQPVLAHHTQPYPAVEYVHGHPHLIFNLPAYAGKNLDRYQADPAFAAADGSAYLAWAGEKAVAYKTDATTLAKAMVLAKSESTLGAFPKGLAWVNQQTFFGTIALILVALVLLVFARRRPDQLKPANRVQHAIEAAVLFIRDEIVRPNFHHAPHHGDAWVPHFAAIFIAILAMNVFGLAPVFSAATGNIAVTIAWALTTLVCMLGFGIATQGPVKFFVHLSPIPFSTKPMDLILWPVMFILEFLGLFIKAAALAIRLFANLFAGHSVLLAFSCLGLIIYWSTFSPVIGGTDSPGMVGAMGVFGWILCVAIYFLELLISFLQAYVFTMLSAVFISQAMHPEH